MLNRGRSDYIMSEKLEVKPLTSSPPSLRSVLDFKTRGFPGSLPGNRTGDNNLAEAIDVITKSGRDPLKCNIFVDIGNGRQGSILKADAFPTITATRASVCDYWVTSLERRVTPLELMRAQGFDVNMTTSDFSNRALGKMVGNAMSVPVLTAVLTATLRTMTVLQTESHTESARASGNQIKK